MSTESPLDPNQSNPKLLRILRRGFSFPVMLAGLLALLAVLTVRSRFDNSDLWWHLRMGQIICATHAIPLSDVFSYTTNHQPLVPQEWLSEVTIFAAWRWAGLSGLMLWLCFFTGALLVAGYALCSLYSGNVKVAFAGALAIWFFASVGYAVRPQMIGYLLLVAELVLIHLGRTRNPRWFLCLPLLFALWINCHGSFLLGIVVAGVFLFSSFFSFEMGSLLARRWEPRCRRMLMLAMILSLAALFLNPAGARQIFYPIDTMLNQRIQMANVQEWMPLKMSSAGGIALMGVLLGSFLLAVVRRSELFFDELLLLAIGTWLAVSHMRMLIVFGILATPVLTRQLSTCWQDYRADEDRIWPNALMIALSLLAAWMAFPDAHNLQAQVEARNPVNAVEFIRASHLSGPMLNDYPLGGYLIWAAPEYPVFVDGRGDVFEWTGVLGEFERWAMLQSDPHELLEKYKISFCLLTRESPMAHVLPLMPEWKMVYSDNNSVVFVRAAANRPAP
ncbi:MAG: hypothetical protein ABSC48_17780 [Terracidiphilus sp.]